MIIIEHSIPKPRWYKHAEKAMKDATFAFAP